MITFNYDQFVESAWLATTNLARLARGLGTSTLHLRHPSHPEWVRLRPSIAFREVFSFSSFMTRLVGGIQALIVRPAMSCMTKE